MKRHKIYLQKKAAALLAVSLILSNGAGGSLVSFAARGDSPSAKEKTWDSPARSVKTATGSDADRNDGPPVTLATPSEIPEEELPVEELLDPEAPDQGLSFHAAKKEYAQLHEAAALPETAEVWVKLTPGQNRRQVILGNYKGAGEVSWSIEVNSDNTLRYWEYTEDKKQLSGCKFDGVNAREKINVCKNEWMLISIVRDREEKLVKAYINGELAGSYDIKNFEFSEEGTLTGDPTRLGTDYRSSPYWMEGEIAEVRFWDYALTDEEIAEHASFGLTGEEDGLEHLWNFSAPAENGAVRDLAGDNDIELLGFSEYSYETAGFENMSGISFENSADQLAMKDRLSDIPRTFEAVIRLPEDLEGRGGVIAGNYMNAGYYDYDLGYVNFEIYDSGAPRLYWKQGRRNQPGGGTESVVFDRVDVRKGDWLHLAIVFDDENDTAYCYVNGALASKVTNCKFQPVVPAQALKIGGDYRGSGGQAADAGYNTQYFKGEIANINIFSSVRSAEEIKEDFEALKADAKAVPGTDGSLLASLSFAETDADYFEDRSENGNDAAAFVDWLDPDFAQGDYSLVALPDTQFLSEKYPDKYKVLTQWIADNRESYNIQAVIHMGDMVNAGTDAQWTAAKEAMDILDTEGISWMPMRGNHDPSEGFNETFSYSRFADRAYFGGSYENEVMGQDKLDSTYWEIKVGEREYLILSLGWAPTQGAIDWAENIVKSNPDKNVILTAHGFMYWDGTHLNDEDLDYVSGYVKDGVDGSKIWEQIGAKYENVILAMGGHIGYPDIIARTDKNGAGNQVTSLLCDAQGMDAVYGLGMMMLLTFHEDSDQVDVNWFSASEGKLFRSRNQFSIDVPHISGNTGGEPENPEKPGEPDEPEKSEKPGKPDESQKPGNSENPGKPSSGHSFSGNAASSAGGESSYYDSKRGMVNRKTGIITGAGNRYSRWQLFHEEKSGEKAQWKLQYADGTFCAGVLTADGKEQPAWELVNGNWYAFGADGVMKTGFILDPAANHFFYAGTDGAMLVGWQQIDGSWYYFNTVSDGTKGRMYASAVTPDGYLTDETGKWIP